MTNFRLPTILRRKAVGVRSATLAGEDKRPTVVLCRSEAAPSPTCVAQVEDYPAFGWALCAARDGGVSRRH